MNMFTKIQEFLASQYDYIYFFYGLSFLLMAIICYVPGRERHRAMPWLLLGGFGVIHGCHEWTELALIHCQDSHAFSMARLVLLAVSYVVLLEFARKSFSVFWKRAYALLVYVPFICLVWLMRKTDISMLNIVARYMLGVPAGLLSAWAIYKVGRASKIGGSQLLALSFAMALYAIATAITASKTEIWPSMWINAGSFMRLFSVPIPLIRGTLILFAAAALWFYSQSLPQDDVRQIKYRIHFKPSKWVMAVTMLALILLGWVLTNYLDYYGSTQIVKSSKADLNSPVNRLNRELTKLEWAVISMSISPRISYVLTLPAPKFIDRSKRLLNDYRKTYSALDCFLTDVNGVIIASASGAPIEAASGNTSRNSVYFKEAISGRIGHYFVPGPSNEERVYYVSAPIKQAGNIISGVIVIKKNIAINAIMQYRLISIVITLFVSILAIILFIVVKRREHIIAFAEEANRRLNSIDELKDHFISIVSHELRTPLTSIKNAAALMAGGWPDRRQVDESQKKLLDVILKNTDRQIRMIGDLLDVSKIEAGVIAVHPEEFNVVALAADVISALRPQAEEKGIALNAVFDSNRCSAFADPEHIRRVLSNLVENAIKFTPTGGAIILTLERRDSGVVATVSDKGVGISPDEINKLFNKFYRTDYASRYKEGSGLGLVISKGLVEANAGKIWAISSPGKGSSFHFTLPASPKNVNTANSNKFSPQSLFPSS